MSKKLKFIFVVFLMGTLVFVPNFSYSATKQEEVDALNQQIKQHKDKIKELEATMNKYKENIAQKQLEATSLKNQISILDNHIDQVKTDVELTQEKIKATQLEIDILGYAIQDKAKVIDNQKKMLASMVQKIQADDQKNSVEIMLTQDSFADFYSQLKNLEEVYSDVGRSVKDLRVAKEEFEGKKKQVEERKQAYATLKNQLVSKQQDLNEQMGAKQTLLTDTKASEAQYQTLLSSLKKQYQDVEGQIRSVEDQVRKKLAEQNKVKNVPAGDLSFSWPVPSHYITAYFHDPKYPFRNVFEHSAIDIRAAQGTPVRAIESGYVGRARTCTTSSCYAYVLLIHTSNLSSVYGHLSRIDVKADQFVNKGDVIGLSGATPGTVGAGPFVTGAHLHLEVRLNGIPVDPLGYLAQ
jgi:murein DD-endopeptidase MepM/ murein hydrolase activator NlpD